MMVMVSRGDVFGYTQKAKYSKGFVNENTKGYEGS